MSERGKDINQAAEPRSLSIPIPPRYFTLFIIRVQEGPSLADVSVLNSTRIIMSLNSLAPSTTSTTKSGTKIAEEEKGSTQLLLGTKRGFPETLDNDKKKGIWIMRRYIASNFVKYSVMKDETKVAGKIEPRYIIVRDQAQ